MKQSEAMTGARAHIVWILALVLSTTAVIYLENLDLGAPRQTWTPSERLTTSVTEALQAAEQRYLDASDARSAAALVLALTTAVQAGVVEAADVHARVATLSAEAANAPEWGALAVILELTFGE